MLKNRAVHARQSHVPRARRTDGPVQAALGGYPLMAEAESLLALEAACEAFGTGCGEWPTMAVADRIRCVEAFIPVMQAARERAVRAPSARK